MPITYILLSSVQQFSTPILHYLQIYTVQ